MSADVPRLLDALGLTVRKHGSELWAPCPHPDHVETRPSWSIIDLPYEKSNGTHHCFGCHFGGGPVDLVRAVVGVSWGGARQWITDRHLWLKGSLPLAVEFQVVNRYATGLKIPGGLISGPLPEWVTPVRRYVQGRGITDSQVQRWELCYAIDGAMGGRVVFPVKDETTKWLSWHARTYCDQDKRYKNASHDDGFDPGAIFGMRHWPAHEARKDATLVVTEGAIDSLACERAGAAFIGAVGGSEPHARQLLKLGTWGRILVATDGDKAGDAMFRFLVHSLGGRSEVLRVAIPPGADAAELPVDQLRVLLRLAGEQHA